MNIFFQLIDLYSDFRIKIFVLLRFLMCPFIQMERYLPKQGIITDIGCGEGVFSIFLSLKSKNRKIIGVDLNRKKVSIAKNASRKLNNITFKVENAIDLKLNNLSGIVISDAFHHFSLKDQEKFLIKTKQLLKKGGILLIKEINKDDFPRAQLSRLWDLILYPFDKINYWSTESLVNRLKNLGFSIKVRRAAFFFPGSTILYICLKE